MSKSNNLGDFLTGIADAIRAKTGSSALIDPQDFDTEIANLPTGGNQIVVSQQTRTFTRYRNSRSSSGMTQWTSYTLSNVQQIPISNAYVYDWNTETIIELQNGTYNIYNYLSNSSIAAGSFSLSGDEKRFFQLESIKKYGDYATVIYTKTDSIGGNVLIKLDESSIVLQPTFPMYPLTLFLADATVGSDVSSPFVSQQVSTARSPIVVPAGIYLNGFSILTYPDDSSMAKIVCQPSIQGFLA